MPVSSGSQSLFSSFPTFMSVWGDASAAGNATAPSTSTSTSTTNVSHISGSSPQNISRRPSYQSNTSSNLFRRDSGTTVKTESTDSSPTTTISTVESSLTEPSPSSSPESPNSLLPAASLHPSRVNTPVTEDEIMYRPSLSSTPSPSRDGFSRSDSPNKKPRNTKNLSVNTSGANKPTLVSCLPRLSTSERSALTNHAFSAPASPSFVIPVMAPKRKPSNLGLCITTPETVTKVPFQRSQSDVVPQTPSLAQFSNARQFDESVQLFSPMGAPAGGMRLPPLGNASSTIGPSKSRPALSLTHHASFDSNRSSPIVQQTLDHVPEESDHDLPLSREIKSPAYPEGPVCIYDPNVYLFLEPNDEEAAKFDVVINVASEVRNPFLAVEEAARPDTKDFGVQVDLVSKEDNEAVRVDSTEHPTAVPQTSLRSVFESAPSGNASHLSNATKVMKNQPEYIHLPWEHNTKVSLELLSLCELIDDRVKRGKRVLIHCQCGVSRSASLIIAYGLYKNPGISDIEAYNAVKDRSKWINPNMHFIFELHAFKKMLDERFPRPAPNRRGGPGGPPKGLTRTQTDSVLKHTTLTNLPMSPLQDEPSTAPLEREQDVTSPRSNSLSPPSVGQLAGISTNGDITPGPSSAPADMIWSPSILNLLPQTESTNPDTTMSSPPPIEPTTITVSPHRESTMTPMMLNLSTSNTAFPSDSTNPPEQPLTEANAPPIAIQSPAQQSTTDTTPSLRPMPSLPAGFTTLPSLLSRRAKPRSQQPTTSLPLRDNNPSPPSIQPAYIPIDTIMSDAVPATPSILSPRAVEFTTTPFHRTVAGDLAGSSVWERGLVSPRLEGGFESGLYGGQAKMEGMGVGKEDPRSPPVRGEVGVWRRIDDVI